MKKLKIFVITLLAFFPVMFVHAGTCNFKINSSDTVKVGERFIVTFDVSDIVGFEEGLAAAQGDVKFDTNYLGYVQKNNGNTDLTVSYGTNINRFAAVGLNGEFIKNGGNLFSISFDAKTVGKTKITVENLKISDKKYILHNCTVLEKEVTIVDKLDENNEPTPTPNPTPAPVQTTKPTKTPAKSSDCSLESLTINNAKMSPAFDKTTLSYNVTAPNMSSLNIDYKTSNSKAKVKITGNKNLHVGQNTVEIEVTAEDGNTKTYTLNVEILSDYSSNKLASLKVKEGSISPKFDPDTNVYTIKVKKKTKKLTLDAIAEDSASSVETIDNNDLDSKNSVVLIKVTDKNGFSNYYKLQITNSNALTILGVPIIYPLICGMGLIFILIILLLILKKVSDKQVIKSGMDLYDDIVTFEELKEAFKDYALNNDAGKLKLLLQQESANRLKKRVAKEELLNALERNDKKRIEEIQASMNSISDTLAQSKEEAMLKDQLVDAINKKDGKKIKELIKISKYRG